MAAVARGPWVLRCCWLVRCHRAPCTVVHSLACTPKAAASDRNCSPLCPAACRATFTLAQLLLKAPCCPLALAVRFGHGQAARTLLAAVRAGAATNAQRHLEDALAWWPSGSELQAGRVWAWSGGLSLCAGSAAGLAVVMVCGALGCIAVGLLAGQQSLACKYDPACCI